MKIFGEFVLIAVISAFPSIATTNAIHQVDFKNNFQYRPSGLRLADTPENVEYWQLHETAESITVTNGIYQSDDPNDETYFMVSKITYGKLNGQSNEIAIVIGICNTSGSGNFSDGFIYGMVNNRPKLLAVIDGGDRAINGIDSVTVEHGLLRVERFGTTRGASWAEWTEARNYKLLNGKLIEVGPPRRRKYKEPITKISSGVANHLETH